MEAIITFFTSLIDTITNLLGFVLDFVGQMLDMIVMVGEAAVSIPLTFLVLPPPATVALTSILTIAIAYKLLGRE